MLSLALALAACQPNEASDQAPPQARDPHDPAGTPSCTASVAVLINELSSSNVSTLVDEEGDTVDWLEIYNADTVAVDLGGWSLTDDRDEPKKWVFPPYKVEPGEFLLIYASGKGQSSPVAAWDTRVDKGDTWRYLEVTEPPDPDWFSPDYDDSAWPTGPSGFGRDDDDDATHISARTAYVRTQIALTAEEVADVAALYLHVDYDDAFVAYLNGVEVARAGIGAPGNPPAWDAFASSDHEAQLYQGKPPVAFDLTAMRSLLVEGANTLALEVHDISAESSDLSLVPLLTLGFGTARPARSSQVIDMASVQLHTNFSLKAEGEEVRLFDSAGCRADTLDPGQMLADQSYGRRSDGAPDLGYFMEPTPGAPNTTESRPGFAKTPVFDPPPGHYPGGTSLSITSGPEARIYVAWDGEEPTEQDALYIGPLQTGTDKEAVVVRARAYQDGLWPSRIATATYLMREPGTLPILSLVTEPANLWDEETGIHVFGTEYEPEPPYYGANFWEDWEKPIHVEEWEPDGSMGFSVDAGISIHGGYSRAHEQKNLLVKLSSGYGDDTIEHEIFPGLGVTSFTRLLLRAAGTDWHGCFISGCSEGAHLRDALMHELTSGSGVDVMAYRPAEVYLNGVWWGIYDLRERPDAAYIYDHYGLEETEIDLLEMKYKVMEGDSGHYEATLDWMRTHDLADPANYDYLKTLIDIDELTAYLIFEIYYDNRDWPGNNIRFWRPRTPEGRWRWLLYDTDFGLGRRWANPAYDTLAFAMEPNGPNWPNPPWSTELFRLLLTSPEFTEGFINRYADYMNTLLSTETMQSKLDEFAERLAPYMPRHVERWGSWTDGTVTWVMQDGAWERELDWIHDWMAERPAHARQHVVNNFGLAGTWDLSLQSDPPGAGTFRLTAIEVEAPFTGTYFQGVPVTITVVPAPGYSFVGWSDSSLGNNPTITLDPVGARSLVAHFE